jgi:YD repeat-containing protein
MNPHRKVNREHWGLRGSVKSCRLQRIWCLNDDRTDTTFLEFRRDGACERWWNLDPRGLEWTHVNEYDSLNRLFVTRATGPSGWTQVRRYEYDSAGRLSRVLERNAQERERVAETYSYDTAGLKTHTRHLESGSCANVFLDVDGTDACFALRGAVAITTRYDAHGRPVTALFVNESDQIVNRVGLHYDEAGHLVDEASMSEPETESRTGLPRLPGLDEPFRRSFRYDEHGRRIETAYQRGPLGLHRTAVSYNEQGDESLTVSYDEDRAYDIDAKGQISTVPIRESIYQAWTRFRYLYDGHGNWLEQVIEGRTDPNQEWVVANIECRTITYFD